MTENKFNYITYIYKTFFSIHFLYEIMRNIFTIFVIGIILFIFLNKYPSTSEYILLPLLLFVGVIAYFCFPILSRIPILTIINELHMDNRGYINLFPKKDKFYEYFENLPDKKKAWNDLILLIKEGDDSVRITATTLLSALFSHIPNKNQAWKDLHQLTIDTDKGVRMCAANILVAAFPQIPDKKEAWNDLIRLTHDNVMIQKDTFESLGAIFSHIPNKNQAWKDLHQLTMDTDKSVRMSAANILTANFPQIPDKKDAWNDLIRLMHDEDKDVRHQVAYSLTTAFSPVTKEKQDNLIHLTDDKKLIELQNKVKSLDDYIFFDIQDEINEIEPLLRHAKYKHENQELVNILPIISTPHRKLHWNELILPFENPSRDFGLFNSYSNVIENARDRSKEDYFNLRRFFKKDYEIYYPFLDPVIKYINLEIKHTTLKDFENPKKKP